MNIDLRDLRARFGRAVAAAGGKRPPKEIFEELVARYGETHRHYHTLEHIDACLVWLDWFSSAAERPEEVELALWFHDVVYDPKRSDNERLSADLARDRLGSTGVPSAAIDRVASYVLSTERHAGDAGDSALVSDIDLTILGASSHKFETFESQIRREYAHVPEERYFPGRRAVLEGLLGRREIYRAQEIRAEFDARARANLKRRISELSRS
jgi:predicted metal-dependent HD superfamily phosphohydrolase